MGFVNVSAHLFAAGTHERAYHVRDREGASSFWTRIGAAWAHADGKGSNLQLEVVPLDGRIVLRVATEKKD